VSTALVLLGTALTNTLKLVLVAPPGTVIEAGTVSARLPLDNTTRTPLAGAAADRATVQLVEPGVCTVVGEQVTVEMTGPGGGAASDREAVLAVPFRLTVTLAVSLDGMVPALAVKLAEVEPPGTRTDAGTVNSELLLEMATVAPPAGAAWVNVTAHAVEVPVVRVESEQFNPDRAGRGASSESVAWAELPLRLAVITALVLLATALAAAAKVALLDPAGTATVAGAVTAGLPLDNATARPPVGAAADRDTVQMAEPGVSSEVGLQVRALKLVVAEM
jgi:hypothetical protein